jgi:protein phosphatase
MSETANLPPSLPAVEIALRTDPGRDPEKQVNEDAAAHAETRLGILAVVCDGMGGHAGGKEASELALRTIVDHVQNAPNDTSARDALKKGIEEANRRVCEMPIAEHGLRPGSTVVCVLAHARGAEIAHVGDSRVYLVHAGAISQVTKDHSMVQEMVDRNLIRAEDAATHPDANKILRALGIAKDVDVDVRHEPIVYTAGDVFVLCSDGLSDLVGASEILQIAGSHPPAQAAGQLVDLANARGGHDNVTAMVVRMKSAAQADSNPTLVKTVSSTQALTPHEVAPHDVPSGPKATLLVEPVGAHAPMPPPGSAPAPAIAIPPAPPPPPSSHQGRSRAPVILILGILLAIVAVGIAAVLVWSEMRPRHVSVPVVPPAVDAGTTVVEEDASAPTSVTGAPPLQEPPVCAKARAARAKNAAWASKLEDQCRAAGGVIAPASATVAPTATIPHD